MTFTDRRIFLNNKNNFYWLDLRLNYAYRFAMLVADHAGMSVTWLEIFLKSVCQIGLSLAKMWYDEKRKIAE
jgi:hypothetical protein